MKLVQLLLAMLIAAPAFAQDKPHVILLTQSRGFVHPVTIRNDGQDSLVEKTFKQLAEKDNFDLECTQDASTITPEKLKQTQVVVFYTTGILPIDAKMLDQWVKDGGSFMGIHSATDTFHITKEHPDDTYIKMIGGEFVEHPWTQDVTVTIKVLEPENPIVKPYAPEHVQKEEVYHQKNFDPSTCRVLMCLDMEKTQLKKPFFIPMVWIKNWGKGKVLYTEIGHRPDDWTSQAYQDQLSNSIAWLSGKIQVDATPNPEVSAKEEELAKKAAGENK